MESQRIISIILTDLSLENLKLQENLEKAINSTDGIDSTVYKVKDALKSLAINHLMITKFQSLITKSNNTQQNQNENG